MSFGLFIIFLSHFETQDAAQDLKLQWFYTLLFGFFHMENRF